MRNLLYTEYMDQETKNKLDALEQKVDQIFISVEKTRRYFQWIFWITIIAFVLPIVGLLFAIPSFLSGYGALLQM